MIPKTTLARAFVLALAASSGAFALWACGPFFPKWLVTDESLILEAPTSWLKDLLEPTPGGGSRHSGLKAVAAEQGPYRQTADVDLRDLETATSNRNLAARYAEVRESLARYGEAVDSWRQEAAWGGNPPPRPEPPAALDVPAGLPGELDDYVRGAIAYHQGRLDAARASWQKLLDRPQQERRRRSTWAAYMLGKVNLTKDPEAAVKWFEQTRELAAQGFPDPLGLAAASFGWQARAELNRKRPAAALPLYLRQMRTGDPSALQSIRVTARKALEEPESLKAIAGSSDAEPIMTAYVISRWDRIDYDGPLDPAPARKWLEAIKAVNPKNVDGAPLAWVAYRAGDFAAAEEWLKRASGPMASWIQAKLLMRAGKLAEAESALNAIRGRLPMGPGPDHDPWQAYENQVYPALSPHAQGDSGAVQLARGDYTGALGALLYNGYWTDAAYVAERVLTTDELREYAGDDPALAAHRPEGYADGWELPFTGLVMPDKERIAYDLRYLVGRRLAREGRYAEAEKFLPTLLRSPLTMLARSAAEGNDARRPAEERARSLFKAACVTRHQGLELLGTELEPDWFVHEGQYEQEPFAKARAGGAFKRLGPTPDERQRAAKSQVKPAKRFHYRYRAADLARSAADLLPDGSVQKARMLATAGNWLEGRDPEAAKPLLDTLLSCCGDTALGRKARQLKAIPNIEDSCGAETRGKEEDG
ncbi:MAG TPA: hypothetical protein VKK31_01450 [Thermoanaerobaculia bacterium]|nr:hypothetical protein [Thermoanaerobaculia bacterium]